MKLRTWTAIGISLAAAVLCIVVAHALSGGRVNVATRTYRVKREEVTRKLIVRGVLEAHNVARVVTRTDGVITELAPTATRVQKGDVVLALDTTALKFGDALWMGEEKTVIARLEAERDALRSELAQVRASEEDQLVLLKKKLQAAELRLAAIRQGVPPVEKELLEVKIGRAGLEARAAREELIYHRKLCDGGFISDTVLGPFERRAAAAEVAFDEKKRELTLRREATGDEEAVALEAEIALCGDALKNSEGEIARKLRSVESEISVHDSHLGVKRFVFARSEHKTEGATLRAEIDGVVRVLEFESWRAGERWSPYAVGMERRGAQHTADILDTTVLDIHLMIHQSDRAGLEQGAPAVITLPAYPGRTFRGRLATLSGVGYDRYDLAPRGHDREPSGVVVFRATVEFDSEGAELRPGMSALVELALDERPRGALVVPRAALHREGDTFTVQTRAGSRVHELEITGQIVDEHSFAVESGLKEGDIVFARDTSTE